MFKHCVINILIVIINILGNAVYVNKSVCSTIYMHRVLKKKWQLHYWVGFSGIFHPCV